MIDLKSMTDKELIELKQSINSTLEDRNHQRRLNLAKQFADIVLTIKKEFPSLGATYGYCDSDGTEIDFIRDLPDTKGEIVTGFEHID